MNAPLVEIRDLSVEFPLEGGERGTAVRAVRGVDLDVPRARTLGLVGESGSGKSSTALAVPRLLSPPGRVSAGRILWRGEPDGAPLDLAELDETGLRRVRGREIGVVFQEPATALHPAYTAGEQIAEVARLHLGASRAAARELAVEWLARVGIPDPHLRAADYPHALSGGMRQRVTLAMALCAGPKLLIADEPTASLDVTVQAQILDLLRAERERAGMSALVVTHDLGVIAEVADEVAVMYAGRVVERGDAPALLASPAHPYTRALLASESFPIPVAASGGRPALPRAIPGNAPDPRALPSGCAFHPRCPEALERCPVEEPAPVRLGERREVRCWARGGKGTGDG